jgi:hypothetical protein
MFAQECGGDKFEDQLPKLTIQITTGAERQGVGKAHGAKTTTADTAGDL